MEETEQTMSTQQLTSRMQRMTEWWRRSFLNAVSLWSDEVFQGLRWMNSQISHTIDRKRGEPYDLVSLPVLRESRFLKSERLITPYLVRKKVKNVTHPENGDAPSSTDFHNFSPFVAYLLAGLPMAMPGPFPYGTQIVSPLRIWSWSHIRNSNLVWTARVYGEHPCIKIQVCYKCHNSLSVNRFEL